jgi:hypothetical protein
MSGDILTYPTDSAAAATDFVATEKVTGGRVFRQKTTVGDLIGLGPTTNLSVPGTLTVTGTLTQGSNTTDRVAVKGIYMNPAVVAVAVPTIANDAAENVDRVAVDVSAAFSIQPAVGDAVIAIPMEALPTDCVMLGAYVSTTDTIVVTFGSIEGGGGVTGANKNFNFLVFDLT